MIRKRSGGEGGITRRCAPRPCGAALAGVIPASWLPLLTDPGPREFTSRVAERVGFEPTQTPIEISKFMKTLRLGVPSRPLPSPLLAVDLAVDLFRGPPNR
jgi:hypothetical protein